MGDVSNFVPINIRDRLLLFMSWFCIVFFGLSAVLLVTGIRQVVANGDSSIRLILTSDTGEKGSKATSIVENIRSIRGVDTVTVRKKSDALDNEFTIKVSPLFWMYDDGVNTLKRIEIDPAVETLTLPSPQTRERVRVLGGIWIVALILTFVGTIFAIGLTFVLLRASIQTNSEYLELMRRFGTSAGKLKRQAWAGSINTGVFSGVVITLALIFLLVGLQSFLMQVEDVTPLSAWSTWPLVTAPVWLIPLVFTGASTWASREIAQ